MENPSYNRRCEKSPSTMLIFLCWLVYTVSYLGKVNYSANITQIIDFYGVTRAQAGAVPTFFFFAYGAGQIFNGIFCKKYNMKRMIFISLVLSATINLVIATGGNFAIIKWLWLVNGFALSVLWPTLIRLLSESLPKCALSRSSVVMGTTVAIGTLIIYGLSSAFAALGSFRLSFYTAGVAVLAVAVVWLLLYDRSVKGARIERASQERSEEVEAATDTGEHSGKRLLYASICVLCFYAVGVNLIKDGLTTWVPSILKDEFGLSDAISILLTLFLPVLAVFGNMYALRVHKRIPDYVNHCALVFSVCALLIGVIIGSLNCSVMILMLAGLIAVNFLASSLNSLVTSIFPLFMRGKVNSGFFAGILNGFCYVGSTISSYGLGVIADGYGWTAVFYTLVGFCAVTIIVWCGYTIFKKHTQKTA